MARGRPASIKAAQVKSEEVEAKVKGDSVKVKSLSPNRLFLSNLRFPAFGILEISHSEFKKAEVKRAIELRLLKVVKDGDVEEEAVQAVDSHGSAEDGEVESDE